MKRKKWLSVILAAALVLSVGAAAFAASEFSMTYYPGTNGTVTNMPENDSGTGGETYTVSSTVPRREGYVFLGWELGWEEEKPTSYTLTYHVIGDPTYGIPGDTAAPDPVTGIEPGGSVTLAGPLSTAWKTADGKPGPAASYYIVDYLEKGTAKPVAEQKVFDLDSSTTVVGDLVTEQAIAIDGYKVYGDAEQTKAVPEVQGEWFFSGWYSDSACTQQVTELTDINENKDVYGKWLYHPGDHYYFTFTFLYDYSRVNYLVRYIDIDTAELIHDDKVDYAYEGDVVTEYPVDIMGYTSLLPYVEFVAEDGMIIIFPYYCSDEPEDC